MPNTITPKEFAEKVNSDGRTVRKFLRACAKAAEVETPGKGSRWAIEAKDVRKLAKGFEAWSAARVPSAGSTDAEAPDES